MAKKASGNKSQAIRDALAAHPNESPKQIADRLVADGYKVNAQYVSTIKSNAKAKRRVRVVRRGRPAAVASSPIQAALSFIQSAGGLEPAKLLLGQVEELRRAL